jgi:hypothetical protein
VRSKKYPPYLCLSFEALGAPLIGGLNMSKFDRCVLWGGDLIRFRTLLVFLVTVLLHSPRLVHEVAAAGAGAYA